MRQSVAWTGSERILDEAAATAHRLGVAEIVRLDEEGEPVETILGQEQGQGADLIIMGAHAIEPHEDLIHTSVSHQVIASRLRPA